MASATRNRTGCPRGGVRVKEFAGLDRIFSRIVSAALPAFRHLIFAGAAIFPLMLGGCMSDALGPMGASMSLQPQMQFASADDLALPDSVWVVPTLQATGAPPGVAVVSAAPAGHMLALAEPDGSIEPMLSLAGYVKAAAISGDSKPEINALIEKYAEIYDLPSSLVHSVVKRESTYNPNAFNKGHWGLMQIKHATARGMGYKGSARGLLDPETNLKYAVKYLKGAYMVSDGNARQADRMYQRGYYYDAKRKGLLDETGLGRDRARKRRSA